MLALTIKQPWATLIAIGVKDVENRTWPAKIRGRIAIHASLKLDHSEAWAAAQLMKGFIPRFSISRFLEEWNEKRHQRYPAGAILATAELYDCQNEINATLESNWFVGPYGFFLRRVIELPEPVYCSGALGFWKLPDDVQAKVDEQMKGRLS